jgi:5'-nucleotidase
MAETLRESHAVTVVAPAQDQSGKSHSFTHGPNHPLTVRPASGFPCPAFEVDGTPCDCIKFSVDQLAKENPPDLVISGINLGENAGISAIYSGTVAAAREAALWNIPALALSLSRLQEPNIAHSLQWLSDWLTQNKPLPQPGGFWNINFPDCTPEEIKGVEYTAMSTVMFTDGYRETVDGHGIKGWLLQGRKPTEQFKPGTDDYALHQNCIAITPLRLDQSDAAECQRLSNSTMCSKTILKTESKTVSTANSDLMMK